MVYMQLKLDHDIIINGRIRSLIKNFKYKLCTVNDIKEFSKNNKIISVGDVTTENLKNNNVNIFLEVVDLKTKRENKNFKHIENSIEVDNPSGVITKNLMDILYNSINSSKNNRIEINGEEDLAVIPIIFYADNNTVIVYGIPDTGMAYIKVDKEIKKMVNNIIMEMKKNER